MRERLTAAFVLLAVVVLAVVITVRAWTVQGLVRSQEAAQQAHEADLIADLLADRNGSGDEIDPQLLSRIIGVDSRLEYVGPRGRTRVLEGPLFAGTTEDEISSRAAAEGITVVLTTSAREVEAVSDRQRTSLIMLALLITLLAGLAGWWLATRLSSQFTRLAGAAAALGRGRFDLQLPDTKVPEARAIGQALKVSAAQLEARLSRERDFAEFASQRAAQPAHRAPARARGPAATRRCAGRREGRGRSLHGASRRRQQRCRGVGLPHPPGGAGRGRAGAARRARHGGHPAVGGPAG